MRIRTLLALALLVAAFSGFAVPRSLAASGHSAAAAALPAGESVIADPKASAAPLRYCPDNPKYSPNEYNPYLGYCYQVNVSGTDVAILNGTPVIMRCWIGDGGEETQYGWTSQKWFYITMVTGNPETDLSGWVYSMVVGSQVSTPECTDQIIESYPTNPAGGSFSIAKMGGPQSVAGGPYLLDIQPSGLAWGSATVYCHVGSSDGYPYGGTVTNLGSYSISSDEFTIPACGTGNQWVGIIASDGIIRYSNQVTIGTTPPPTPPPPSYNLVGTTARYSLSASPGFYIGASVSVDGLTVENPGNTAVTVDQIALAVTSPSGQRTDYTCDDPAGNAMANVTIASGQIIACLATFTPSAAGTWTYNIDWQGTDAQWRDDLYIPMTVTIGQVPTPANDDFANAEDISDTTQFSGDNTNATAEPGEPAHVEGGSARQSVWFKFTAYATGRAWVTMDDINYTSVSVAAYSGSAVGNLTPLASWDGNNSDQIAFHVTKGHVYYIAVDDYFTDSTGGPFAGSYEIAPTTPPSNDDFDNAQPITPGVVYDSDLTDATVQSGEPAVVPGGPNVGSVWYSYRPGEDVKLTLSSPGGDAVEGVGVYSGSSLSSLRVLASTILSTGSPLSVALTAGRTYYIAVASYVGPDPISGIPQPGQFEMLAKVRPQPPAVTTVLPTLYTGEHYSTQLHAKDGTAPYTWRLKQPSAATGIGNFKLSSTGLLTGGSGKLNWGEGSLDILITDSENPKVVAERWISERVVLDDTPPSGHLTKISTGRGSMKASWTAADSQSGYDYAQIRYQRIVTSGKQPGWVTTGALRGASAGIRISTAAKYRIEIRFIDRSGNISGWTAARTFTIKSG